MSDTGDMDKKKVKLTDFESFDQSPFQQKLRGAIKFGWRRIDPDKARKMVDQDSGEVIFVSDANNVQMILKDPTEFTKIYLEACSEINKLSTSGVRMLTYVMSIARRDTDWVRIDIESAMKWCGYESRTNVYSGLLSLLTHEFISRKTGNSGEYFINVNYFFNGRRTTLSYGNELRERVLGELKTGKLKLDDNDEDKGE